ncbi:MAG: hypothetical protein ACRDXC_06370 [Acidimicrobiales bacterium]
MALRNPLVHVDLFGWPPKYFPSNLIQYANTLLKNDVLFGYDFPAITPDQWLTNLEKIDIRHDVRPFILKEHTAPLLELGHS